MGGIQQIEEQPRFQIRGIIRLGYKEDGDRGRMHNTEHFILKDAPDVEKVYGADPKAIDIVFPGNDIDTVAFTAFQHWTGKRNPDGTMTGFLTCQGNGPSSDGTPGTATWFDRDYAPPQDEWIGERDPINGYIQRACYGEGARGACRPCLQCKEKKCGPRIIMKVIIPLVSIYEIYLITSSSWNTIANVRNQLRVLNQLGVPLPSRVFTLFKDTKAARVWDPVKQREYKNPVYYVKMEENKDFMSLHAGTLREALKAISTGGLSTFLPAAPAGALPTSDLIEIEGEVQEPQLTEEEKLRQAVQELLADTQINEAFDTLEHFRNTKYPKHVRAKAIEKKKNEPDMRAAVLAELDSQIRVESDKLKKVSEPQQEAVGAEVAPNPEQPAEPGIM